MIRFFRKTTNLLCFIVFGLGFKRTRVQYSGEIPGDGRLNVALKIDGIQIVHIKFQESLRSSDANSFGWLNAYSVFFKNELVQSYGFALTAFKCAVSTITYRFNLQ